MDSKYRRNGRLIDIVDEEWKAEKLPDEDIQVPLEELPDPEADNADSHLTLKEQSMRWQENFPEPASKTEKIAKKTHGALTILKQFGIHECNHKEPVSGSQCILSMVGKKNDKHYILATQDRDLQDKMRSKPGVPLLYLHNKSPTLEKPSETSYTKAGQTLEANTFMFISQNQNEALKTMKKTLGVEEKEEANKALPKKRKHKNPNPLSCKKKKKKSGLKQDEKRDKVIDGRVRKRKKSKHKNGVPQTFIQL
ncbi:rRNA-processing protein UTP23 homolog isoform X3 [Pararge aegeria]|uniref:rRNA-processing protein UTP23 homolog isoform X3 n=1 Tax=Pararge aegeria TaxID=116150 RepID=UPI0019D1730C|nr:rRNA-processing protein UTP23 homolog isoform X3 [Pararge aegeria]